MRVLILLASTDRRGAELEGQRLSAELGKFGIEADAVALAPGASAVRLDLPVLGRSSLGLSTLIALRRRSRDFDVVIAYGSTTLPACAVGLIGARAPFIYRSIGDPAAWVRGGLHRRRTSLLLRRASAIITLWPDAERSIQDLYGVPASKLRSIPNARSNEEFHPPSAAERVEARRHLQLADDQFVVATIGALSSEKRIDLALEAVSLIPDARLVVAGDGPDRDRLESASRTNPRLAGRTQMLGSVEDVAQVLHASDVLLLTSRTEGMPGVLIEAALCGLPVVATNVGAIGWMFDEQVVTGALAPHDATASQLAGELERIRNSPSQQPNSSACQWKSVAKLWSSELEAVVNGSMAEREEPVR